MARSAIDVFSVPQFEDQDWDAFVLDIAEQSVIVHRGFVFPGLGRRFTLRRFPEPSWPFPAFGSSEREPLSEDSRGSCPPIHLSDNCFLGWSG